MNPARGCKQFTETKVEMSEHSDRHQRSAAQQQHRLRNLDPCCRLHATDGHVKDHQDTDTDDGKEIFHAEQEFDDFACTDHLGHEIEQHNNKASRCRDQPNGRLVEAKRGGIGECVTSEITHTLGHQEQNDRPTGQKAHGVYEPVKSVGIDERRDSKERSG